MDQGTSHGVDELILGYDVAAAGSQPDLNLSAAARIKKSSIVVKNHLGDELPLHLVCR